MLEALRGMMGGIVAKIFIGLLVLSFAVWGVSDVFIGGPGDSTVEVGETKVGLADYRFAYEQRVNAVQNQLNQRLTREQLRTLGVEQAVLSQIVSGAVLDESARRMGLGLSDDELAELIAEDPSFRDGSGNFSRTTLDFVLREIGMSQEDYIRNRRAFATRNQLISAMAGNLALPETFYEALGQYQGQRRIFDYVVVGPADLDAPVEPAPSDLQTYFEANRQAYVAPEYRELVVVRLTAEDIADPQALPQEAVRERYETGRDEFAEPERRRVQQLTFQDPARAAEMAERLDQGENFETILAEMGRSAADVDLGLLTRSELPDQNVAEAAFALPLNTPSGVVDGIFGPVILRVTEIRSEEIKPFEEVEADIRQTMALEQAAEELYDIHDRLEDERAAGETLTEAARTAGLEARVIEAVDARGRTPGGEAIEGIPESGRVIAAAFDTDEGVEADPIFIGSDGFVWYEVASVTDERQRGFDEVSDEVREAWIAQETRNRVETLANQVRERAEGGTDLAAAAAEFLKDSGQEDGGPAAPADTQSDEGTPAPATEVERQSRVQTSAELTRNDTSSDLGAAAVRAGFAIEEGEFAVAPGADNANRVVLRVAKVVEDKTEPPDPLVNQLNDGLADDLLTGFITDLQAREDVIINRQAIETAITF